MKPTRLINIHTHLRKSHDVVARVLDWQSNHCIKVCVAAMPTAKQSPNSNHFGNDDLLPVMRKYSGLVAGLAALELGAELSSPDEIDRRRDQGFLGLKFNIPSEPYDHERYFPLYERAEQMGMPILFNTAWLSPDVGVSISSENQRPWHLDRIARVFPKLRMIGTHLGLPHFDEAIRLAVGMPAMWFDISGGSASKFHINTLKRALAPPPGANWDDPEDNIAAAVFKKLVFGTDNVSVATWLPAAENLLDYFRIPEATREMFYWRNAAEIFGWKL